MRLLKQLYHNVWMVLGLEWHRRPNPFLPRLLLILSLLSRLLYGLTVYCSMFIGRLLLACCCKVLLPAVTYFLASSVYTKWIPLWWAGYQLNLDVFVFVLCLLVSFFDENWFMRLLKVLHLDLFIMVASQTVLLQLNSRRKYHFTWINALCFCWWLIRFGFRFCVVLLYVQAATARVSRDSVRLGNGLAYW